jgi:hypothetical protein
MPVSMDAGGVSAETADDMVHAASNAAVEDISAATLPGGALSSVVAAPVDAVIEPVSETAVVEVGDDPVEVAGSPISVGLVVSDRVGTAPVTAESTVPTTAPSITPPADSTPPADGIVPVDSTPSAVTVDVPGDIDSPERRGTVGNSV